MENNKEKLKKIAAISVMALGIILFILLITNVLTRAWTPKGHEDYFEELSDGSRRNVSGEVMKVKFIDGIQVSDITLFYNKAENESILTMQLNNISDGTRGGLEAIIKLRDENLNPTAELKTWIPKLEMNETTTIELKTKGDITDSRTFSIDEYLGEEIVSEETEVFEPEVSSEE